MTFKHTFKSLESVSCLLANRGDVAADAAEGAGTLLSAEAAGDLLLHLEHADILLGQIIVERHPKVVHEAQRLTTILSQTGQQVLGFGLLETSSSALDLGVRFGQRIGLLTLGQTLSVALDSDGSTHHIVHYIPLG